MGAKTDPIRRCPGVLILAAGRGARMKSSTSKVLLELNGDPLIVHVLRKVAKVCEDSPIAVVVGNNRGNNRQTVTESLQAFPEFQNLHLTFVTQEEPRGTGDAVRCAMEAEWGKKLLSEKRKVLVLPGDSPLISEELVNETIGPLGRTNALRLVTCEQEDPTGYGRVVRRGKSGPVLRIVEHADAKEREKEITEVATSIYLFDPAFLNAGWRNISDRNAQGEFYLTDLISLAVRRKKGVDILKWSNADDLRGVNNPWELSEAGKILNTRVIKKWALSGVRFMDPFCTRVDPRVVIGQDVRIFPGVHLAGTTQIGDGVEVGHHAVIKDSVICARAQIKPGCVIENSFVGDDSKVGPYAHLRPESHVGKNVKIGNFVELKKTSIGNGTSVAHLSYLGDAEVGSNVNIGCGFVTCNFDGRVINGQRKHKTIIEDDVFMGSDCQVIAPIKIGKGSYIASGSTITKDTEPHSLAFGRSRQVTKVGRALKLREIFSVEKSHESEISK